MEEYLVEILNIEQRTHNVKTFRIDKPGGYSFISGQATEVSIYKDGWIQEKRPFTFTCLNTNSYLEFTIKIYPERNGVTKELGKLKPGDQLIIRDVWGAITFKGKGVFIAGGAGVTPFISILRQLKAQNQITGNTLIFANKTKDDIILKTEFENSLGENFINILSEEKTKDFYYGHIDEKFLKKVIKDFNQNFYVCGPPPMVDAVLEQLANLGVAKNSITLEL
jgi:ferredoxin-NADP reductase